MCIDDDTNYAQYLTCWQSFAASGTRGLDRRWPVAVDQKFQQVDRGQEDPTPVLEFAGGTHQGYRHDSSQAMDSSTFIGRPSQRQNAV